MTRSPALILALALVAASPALETSFANVEDAAQAPVMAEHEPFRAVIPLRNPYDRAVKVTRVESACDCNELVLADHFLLPGEATTLTIEVDNARRSGLQRQLFRIEISDPQLEVIDITAWWHVTPDIAVDAMPPAGPFDRRPESVRLRNVYAFTSHQRPDELDRLRKLIRLWSPDSNAPADGLQVTGFDYAGEIWAFTPRTMADGSVLVVAHARDPAMTIPEGKYEELVTIHTNHPRKPTIEIHLYTAIDQNAGKEGTSDPWGHLR